MSLHLVEYRVYDIEWDMSEDGLQPGSCGIPCPPTEVVMSVDMSNDRDPCEAISDILSDTMGWCVFGFNFEEI